MKISASYNNVKTDNKYNQSFKGVPKNPKYIPECIGNLGKLAGEYINTPEQKLFLATLGLMFQPLIDLKYAQEEKKVDSAIKTASKLAAGGITGVSIRAIFLKLADHYIGLDKHNLINKLFKPVEIIELRRQDPDMAVLRMNQYIQTLGTIFAIATMILFTNSKLDVPLTSDFQDLISGCVKENKTFIKSISDVMNSRGGKIKDWFKRKLDIFNRIAEKLNKIADVIKEKNTAETSTTKEHKKK